MIRYYFRDLFSRNKTLPKVQCKFLITFKNDYIVCFVGSILLYRAAKDSSR